MAALRPKAPEEIPEADRLADFPHPRETGRLFGHLAAETAFLDAYRSGRIHHAWLIGGPEGIGKATLAYRIARFVLAHPAPGAPEVAAATDLEVDRERSPAARQIAAQAHPDLAIVRREWNPQRKTLFTTISVDDVRRATRFFSMTSGYGGWRMAIVDCADDMNLPSANALLKTLEEPPAHSLILLVSHAPGRLLPTIRSRCRRLQLSPLAPDDLIAAIRGAGAGDEVDGLAPEQRDELVRLARGSVRRALQILSGDGLEIAQEIDAILASRPGAADRRIHALAERLARRGRDEDFDFALVTISDWLADRIEKEAAAPGAANLARLAEVWEKITRLAAETATFHYDRKQVILKAFRSISAAIP